MEEQTQVTDRRAELKIKIKSLAAEGQLIRVDENKAKKLSRDRHLSKKTRESNRAKVISLHDHRVTVVRDAARYSLLAYAYIRGMPYRVAEASTRPGNAIHSTRLAKDILKFTSGGALSGRPALELDVMQWLVKKPEE
tara:strand:- start:52 stop:465 length:414 start_codon:yes stop_codon:yes gene_type:complete